MSFKKKDPGFPTEIQDVQEYLAYVNNQNKAGHDFRQDLIDLIYFINSLYKDT